ncbi:ORF1192 [White spot syndrome virus]|uniref:ORF1192 n=1 Tax=White spot syndrome virus TaxID=342409 RepID=A0A2D3I5N7_9VIRU|nr:ORF1192 [White spot syndrome virus]
MTIFVFRQVPVIKQSPRLQSCGNLCVYSHRRHKFFHFRMLELLCKHILLNPLSAHLYNVNTHECHQVSWESRFLPILVTPALVQIRVNIIVEQKL